VNTVINFLVPKKAGNVLTRCVTTAQEGLCSMELVS
jgi:hypothetical protein